jgi:hypothetical protein
VAGNKFGSAEIYKNIVLKEGRFKRISDRFEPMVVNIMTRLGVHKAVKIQMLVFWAVTPCLQVNTEVLKKYRPKPRS